MGFRFFILNATPLLSGHNVSHENQTPFSYSNTMTHNMNVQRCCYNLPCLLNHFLFDYQFMCFFISKIYLHLACYEMRSPNRRFNIILQCIKKYIFGAFRIVVVQKSGCLFTIMQTCQDIAINPYSHHPYLVIPWINNTSRGTPLANLETGVT